MAEIRYTITHISLSNGWNKIHNYPHILSRFFFQIPSFGLHTPEQGPTFTMPTHPLLEELLHGGRLKGSSSSNAQIDEVWSPLDLDLCLLLFYVKTTSKVISEWVPTCDSVCMYDGWFVLLSRHRLQICRSAAMTAPLQPLVVRRCVKMYFTIGCQARLLLFTP